jgi:alginate O-acetyltransferase complex protein AlgI
MRENTYLITFLLLFLIIISYFCVEHLDKAIKRIPAIDFTVNVVKYTIISILVFTFLRPISQFIYFQF